MGRPCQLYVESRVTLAVIKGDKFTVEFLSRSFFHFNSHSLFANIISERNPKFAVSHSQFEVTHNVIFLAEHSY